MNRHKLVLGGLVTLFALSGVLYQAWLNERGWIGGLLCRDVVCDDEAVVEAAHQRLWRGELDGALEWFRAALRRDAASPYRWCDLGEALLEAGRGEESRQYFRRAVELGGHSPVAMLGDYDGIVFSSYSRMGISVVWKWMGERSLEDLRLADEYAGFLVGARQYERAAREWAAHGGPPGRGIRRKTVFSTAALSASRPARRWIGGSRRWRARQRAGTARWPARGGGRCGLTSKGGRTWN